MKDGRASAPRHDDAALALHGVTVTFGGLVAVNRASMTVPRGQRWAVIGPNGAGKTTLFRTVAGEQPVTSGRIELFRQDVTKLPPHRRARLGLGRTYQVTSIFPRLTVEENLALALIAKGRLPYRSWWPLRFTGDLAARVDASLDDVFLGHRRRDLAMELSHGEQRQLEFGLALASAPKVLLLDEPAAGLSASERVLLSGLIAELPHALTILIIEHDVELAFNIADWVVCMDNGSVIETGTPDEVRSSSRVQAVYLGVE